RRASRSPRAGHLRHGHQDSGGVQSLRGLPRRHVGASGLGYRRPGQPTTDPRQVLTVEGGSPALIGTMLPLGSPTAGHKGFGLSMIVDVLAGVLTGSGFALGANSLDANIGHFFWALDITAFGSRDEFLARVD